VVSALGSGVEGVSEGEPVYALSPFDRDGAAAEYIVIPKEHLARKPETVDHAQAASIPLAALTAWQGLLEHGQLTQGQRVLIHGAAGGVGNFAVQLARIYGAYVIGTVSSMNLQAARKLSMDEIIDHTKTRFEEVVREVDLVFDTAGGDRLGHSYSIVRPGGRLVSVAIEPSQEEATAHEITGIYFVVRPNGEQLTELAKLVDQGKLKTAIDRVYPLISAREAFERSLSAHAAGKIVLRIADQ
jgi:NADPH:quinone reductase-like Zn-dependent oxidoreductase